MSKIPKNIIEKIRAEMKGSYEQGVVREELGMIPHEWRSFAHGASFGYSLSLERIGELEKEVERLKGLLETMTKGFAADNMAMSTMENIESYWQDFKRKNKI